MPQGKNGVWSGRAPLPGILSRDLNDKKKSGHGSWVGDRNNASAAFENNLWFSSSVLVPGAAAVNCHRLGA